MREGVGGGGGGAVGVAGDAVCGEGGGADRHSQRFFCNCFGRKLGQERLESSPKFEGRFLMGKRPSCSIQIGAFLLANL